MTFKTDATTAFLIALVLVVSIFHKVKDLRVAKASAINPSTI